MTSAEIPRSQWPKEDVTEKIDTTVEAAYLGPCKSDYINQLITISGIFYALSLNKWFSEN